MLFKWNDSTKQYERIDRVQEYRGHKIETITYHWPYNDPLEIRNHRAYRVTRPSGKVTDWTINKRGGNIKELKEWIDFNYKYNRTEFL